MAEKLHTLKATIVTWRTLVGVSGKPPYDHGNCFSVLAEDGNEYKVVNFVLENLRALEAAGLTWPVDIMVIGGNRSVIHDKRIPHGWYRDSWCEVCCPEELLPLPQQLKIDRELMQGVRKKSGLLTSMSFEKPDFLIDPGAPSCQPVTEPRSLKLGWAFETIGDVVANAQAVERSDVQDNGKTKGSLDICLWTEVESKADDPLGRGWPRHSFHTSCGHWHCFMLGPLEDKFLFCPYCGKTIKAEPFNPTPLTNK